MSARLIRFLLLAIIGLSAGCANITAPTGGKKDKIPPKLLEIDPPDSMKNTRLKRIDMSFDEYIVVSDASKEVHISPLLPIDPTVTGHGKSAVVKIVDSLLDSNTTYRISFGNAIKDLHEGNPFKGYTYTFSTGAYFDSLELRGNVINAATGLSDTGNILVVLYSASEKDSAVVKHKPKYVARTDGNGNFIFKGLPRRSFRIYALGDANNNLIYDGPAAGDMIGFTDRVIMPGDTTMAPIKLRMFTEVMDSTVRKSLDTAAKKPAVNSKSKNKKTSQDLTYTVNNIDTTNVIKKTFDITKPITITFSKHAVLNTDKIKLTYDSSGITVTPEFSIYMDSMQPNVMHINTTWSENTVYTLRLAKGFAKDTAGTDVMPARFTFRTFEDENYAKITINLPPKYYNPQYIFVAVTDKDTVYNKPVTDTTITLTRLKPAKYTFCIIVDKNGNRKWDTGDLFAKIQPEEVIPYMDHPTLKAGFEYDIDFEQKPPEKKDNTKDKTGK